MLDIQTFQTTIISEHKIYKLIDGLLKHMMNKSVGLLSRRSTLKLNLDRKISYYFVIDMWFQISIAYNLILLAHQPQK